MSGILTVGDRYGSSLLGLTEKGSALARLRGLSVSVVCFCPKFSNEETGLLIAAGARRVLHAAVDPEDLNGELPAAEALAGLIRRSAPDAVLFVSSVFMRNVAPMTAALLQCGLTADCTELSWDMDGRLLQIRPTFGGTRIATIVDRFGPAMATVRKGVFPPSVTNGLPGAEAERLELPEPPCRWLTQSITETVGGSRLSEAKVILSAGLGIGSAENFGRLCRLAESVGAAVGASRAAVAAGFAPYSCQIGQTGLSVRPELYCAFGISGAVQHLGGIVGAKRICAVNRDPEAPIHRYSDISVVADCMDAAERLLAELTLQNGG